MGRVPGLSRIALMALVAGLSTACANAPQKVPTQPDESRLAEAEAMLNRAREAGAMEQALAPLRTARRRLATARSLIYRTASAGTELDAEQRRRVGRLADEAYLDARLALALTRQSAVERRVAELQSRLEATENEEGR